MKHNMQITTLYEIFYMLKTMHHTLCYTKIAFQYIKNKNKKYM